MTAGRNLSYIFSKFISCLTSIPALILEEYIEIFAKTYSNKTITKRNMDDRTLTDRAEATNVSPINIKMKSVIC